MSQPDRDQLRRMLLDRSMRFGEFVLSSGATSNYYIDVRKTSLHPEGLRMIAKMFYEILLPDKVTAVGGQDLVEHLRDQDRKSTRLNSSHRCISYAVFCLKKKRN